MKRFSYLGFAFSTGLILVIGSSSAKNIEPLDKGFEYQSTLKSNDKYHYLIQESLISLSHVKSTFVESEQAALTINNTSYLKRFQKSLVLELEQLGFLLSQ